MLHPAPGVSRIKLLSSTAIIAVLILIGISLFAKSFGDLIREGSISVKPDAYFFDESGALELSSVLDKLRSDQDRFSGALNTDNYGAHWLSIPLSSIPESMDVLQIELAWLDRLSIFYVTAQDNSIEFASGDDEIFTEREIKFRKPAFPLIREIQGQRTESIVLRLQAQGRVSMPMLAKSRDSFDIQRDLDHFFYGAIVAILLALGAYNATIFFSLRDNVHFYYMFYIFAFGFLQIIASGMGQQYGWPDHPDTSSLMAHIFLGLTNFSITLFIIHFISLDEYSKKIANTLRFFAFLSLGCIPFLFFFDYYPFKVILHSCSFIIMAMIFPASIYTSLRGNDVAHFLLASNIVLFPSVAIGLLRFLGLFENAYWAEHLSELGIAAEALILSVGLAYRVNLLQREKEKIAYDRAVEKNSFAQKLIASKEEERRNIGKSLHDSLGHKILSIKASITNNQSSEHGIASHQVQIIDEAIEEIRDLSHMLYPSILEHLGLKKALKSMLDKALKNTPFHYSLEVDSETMSDDVELLLYRACQECTNNLLKYSDGDQFSVSIKTRQRGDVIMFSAEDNGRRKITDAKSGYGLSMLQQQIAVFDGNMQVSRTEHETNQITLTVQNKK